MADDIEFEKKFLGGAMKEAKRYGEQALAVLDKQQKNIDEQRLLKATGYGDILTRHGERDGGIDGVRGPDTIAAENQALKDHHKDHPAMTAGTIRNHASDANIKLMVDKLLAQQAGPRRQLGEPETGVHTSLTTEKIQLGKPEAPIHDTPKPLATPSVSKPKNPDHRELEKHRRGAVLGN